MANLTFYYGTMDCGKTTKLLQRAYNQTKKGRSVAIFKPAIDTKGNRMVVSRLGIKKEVSEIITPKENIYILVKEHYRDYKYIFIDEAQFLKPVQVDQLLNVATKLDIPVECYGIRTDFRKKAFPGSSRLLAVANLLVAEDTFCRCGKGTIFQARYQNGRMALSGAQVEIDNQAEIEYISYCPKCYEEERQKELILRKSGK